MWAVRHSNFVIVLAVMCVLGVSSWGTAAPSGGSPGVGIAPPGDGERVTFKSEDPAVKAPVPATMYLPHRAGPFPAVVLLHPYSGLQPSSYDWGRWLRNLGYVAILPDSFAPRHLHATCGSIDVKPGRQALDSLGALVYLRSRPDIIPRKVAVMGWSHGGAATLASVSPGLVRKIHPNGGPYQAAIALYPGCDGWKANRLTSPLLMLMGSDDDWAKPGPCVEHAKGLQAAGAAIEWKIYPGAMHAFDAPSVERVVQIPGSGQTYHLRYDAAATADVHTQVQRFLGAHLQ